MRMTRAKTGWMVVVVLGLSVLVHEGLSQTTSPPPVRTPPVAATRNATPQQIAKWVEDLESEQFVTREIATMRLIEVGAPAIAPLVERVAKGNLETATRAIHILRELALSPDQAVEDAAREGLEKIAATQLAAAARRATVTLETLNETRQKRAIDELERLGAKLGMGHVQFGNQIESALTIDIGPDWQGEEQDLRRLKWLVGVRQVKFTGTRVNDGWMKYLSGMPNLHWLTLKRTSVSEKGLEPIRGFNRLQNIYIMYSPLGDGAVAHLKTLKSASLIKLYGTNISKAAAKDLQETLEATKIDYRRGGFLGVNCQAHPLGCEVIVVQNGTAAMDAGLESSDVILKYGDRRVESFETLTTHISENAPGEEVKLEIVRNVKLRQHGIDRAADAKLGITGKTNTLGVEVVTLEPKSFVDLVGLRVGDVITGCGETRVLDMAGLEAAFAAAKPGEQLTLDYVRAPQLITKTVKLGEWE